MINKRLLIAGSAVALGLGLASNAVAQSIDSADIEAQVVDPLVLTNIDDLLFGRVSEDGTGGTLTVASDGTTNTTSGASFEDGNQQPASFDVAGESGLSYDIVLPADVLIDDGAGETMEVSGFEDSLSGTGTIGTDDSFTVGATLTIDPNQASGVYNGNFDVEVVYN